MNISEINDLLNNGYVPDSMFWTINKDSMQIDPRKISYTDYYQSYEFYENKFKGDYSSIPGFNKVIENMAELSVTNNNTPLKEINEKIIIDENNNKISSDR